MIIDNNNQIIENSESNKWLIEHENKNFYCKRIQQKKLYKKFFLKPINTF